MHDSAEVEFGLRLQMLASELGDEDEKLLGGLVVDSFSVKAVAVLIHGIGQDQDVHGLVFGIALDEV